MDPAVEPFTVTANDVIFPRTVCPTATSGVVAVFTQTERTDAPHGYVVNAAGVSTAFTLSCGKPKKVWPVRSAVFGAVAHVGATLFTVAMPADAEAKPLCEELATLPDHTEAVDVSAACAGSGGKPAAVVAVVHDHPAPDKDAPKVLPRTPCTRSLMVWTPESAEFRKVGNVPDTSDGVSVSATGTHAVVTTRTNIIAEEAERGEFWVADLAGATPPRAITTGAGRVAAAVITPDNANIIYQANHSLERPVTTHQTLWVVPVDADAGLGAAVTVPGVAPGSEITGFNWVASGAPSDDARQLLYVTAITGNTSGTAVAAVPTGTQRAACTLGAVSTLPGSCTSNVGLAAQPAPAGASGGAADADASAGAGAGAGASAGGGGDVFWYAKETMTEYPCIQAGAVAVAVEQPPGFEDLRVRLVQWEAADGLKVQGAVFERDGMAPDASLLILAHGGPAGGFAIHRSVAAASLRYPVRHYLKAGYRVFEPFFRGTLGFGDAFAQANIGQQGHADLGDIVSGVEHLRTAEGLTFGDRVGIYGGSYGGYMTNRVISTDVLPVKVGISMYGFLSNRWMSLEGGDYTWEDEYLPPGHTDWPLTERNTTSDVWPDLGNVKVPTLVLHGEDDDICPVSQSYALYRALHGRVPTMLRVYPGEGHGFDEHSHRTDRDVQSLLWLAKYMPATA